MFAHAKPEQKSNDTVQKKEPEKVVAAPNQTGIPDAMKTRFENVSGFSFDDVRVHYNSDKPAQLQALAYTQGNQVYVAPRQEKHLGHELGHVVQQKEGRVKPITQSRGVFVNDDVGLETEADVLGRVVQMKEPAELENPVQMMAGTNVVQKLKDDGGNKVNFAIDKKVQRAIVDFLKEEENANAADVHKFLLDKGYKVDDGSRKEQENCIKRDINEIADFMESIDNIWSWGAAVDEEVTDDTAEIRSEDGPFERFKVGGECWHFNFRDGKHDGKGKDFHITCDSDGRKTHVYYVVDLKKSGWIVNWKSVTRKDGATGDVEVAKRFVEAYYTARNGKSPD